MAVTQKTALLVLKTTKKTKKNVFSLFLSLNFCTIKSYTINAFVGKDLAKEKLSISSLVFFYSSALRQYVSVFFRA